MWYSAVGLVVTLTLSLLVVPRTAEAQQATQVHRIGRLVLGSPTEPNRNLEAFRQGLRDLGYVEGQNLVIEDRYAEGREERLPDLAAELVRLQVAVIVAGTGTVAGAASQATQRIPIILAGGDAVGRGLITNIARPDGNITGLTTNSAELGGKWLELLKEAVPAIARVAVLSRQDTPFTRPEFQDMQVVAPVLGVQLQLLSVRDADELEGAFAAMSREHADALIVLPSPLMSIHRARINEFAARSRLPTMWEWRAAVAAGGLMAYGPDGASLWRRAATYVDKICKGAQPADLPVERPMSFQLVINLKTAKRLGITMPPIILFRADEVIQ